MERYLIELKHSDEHTACVRALEAIERHGGNFVRSVDWGCLTGVHAGWLVIEVENEHQALQAVPPDFRSHAKIVKLNKFSKEQIEKLIAGLEEEKA